jgi:chemotaxis protein MotB
MARGRTRRGGDYGEFWPGYVDMLSTLLLVVTFLMSIFMVAQYFATQESAGKDTALQRLTRQISELTSLLSLEKGKSKTSSDELSQLQATLSALKEDNAKLSGFALQGDESAKSAASQIGTLTTELEGQKTITNEALAKVEILNQQLLSLRRQIAALNEALEASEKKVTASDKTINELGTRLNAALARQVQELQRYRSDFFGRLRELLKDRKDIRVVGDRFVFESEVLFPTSRCDCGPRTPNPQRDRLGSAGGWPHRRAPDQQRSVSFELGAIHRPLVVCCKVYDLQGRSRQASRCGWIRRVPADRIGCRRDQFTKEPPHRA